MTFLTLVIDALISPIFFVLVGAGVILTLAIGVDIYNYFMLGMPLPTRGYVYISSLVVEDVLQYGVTLSSEPGELSIGILFYSSLFTSVWVWLYASAAGVTRLTLSLQPVLRWLKWFLDIDGKPIRSIGVVVGLIGAVFWWGLVLIGGPEGDRFAAGPAATAPEQR